MDDKIKTVRLAAIQAAPVFLDRDRTIEKACRLIRDAGEKGAEFVGFPENFVPGYPLWYFYHPAASEKSMDLAVRLYRNSIVIPGPETEALCDAARSAGVYVVIGVTEKLPDATGTLWNTQLFIDATGQIVGRHQKLVPTFTERIVHAPGGASFQGVVPSPFGPVSGLICGENSNPMAVAQLCSQYTRIHVAAWPNHFFVGFDKGYKPMREAALVVGRGMAYMSKCFVVSACGVCDEAMIEAIARDDDDRKFMRDVLQTGGSSIIDPLTNVIAGPMPGNEEGILIADADLELTVRAKTLHDYGGHYNRSDIFQLKVARATPKLLVTCDVHPNAMDSG